jgi:hypothetical protein
VDAPLLPLGRGLRGPMPRCHCLPSPRKVRWCAHQLRGGCGHPDSSETSTDLHAHHREKAHHCQPNQFRHTHGTVLIKQRGPQAHSATRPRGHANPGMPDARLHVFTIRIAFDRFQQRASRSPGGVSTMTQSRRWLTPIGSNTTSPVSRPAFPTATAAARFTRNVPTPTPV